MSISWLLVTGQMMLIALLVSPAEQLIPNSPRSVLGFAFIALSIMIAGWAFKSMRSGTFTVMPEPATHATLTQAGPYAYVRHPMYSAVIVGGLGAVISHATLTHGVVLAALVLLLITKLVREERYLMHRYNDDYVRYKSHTKALVPFVC